MNGRNIALQRAVGFDGNKSALCAEALALTFNDGSMVRVDFRNDHRNVGCAAVGAVVAHYRAFSLGICFLESLNLIFFHVDGAEHEVTERSDLLHILRCIVYNHVSHGGRHGSGHQPVVTHGLAVCFACGARAGRQGRNLEPRMVFEKGCETLTNHAGCADDAYTIRFHLYMPPVVFFSRVFRQVFSCAGACSHTIAHDGSPRPFPRMIFAAVGKRVSCV